MLSHVGAKRRTHFGLPLFSLFDYLPELRPARTDRRNLTPLERKKWFRNNGSGRKQQQQNTRVAEGDLIFSGMSKNRTEKQLGGGKFGVEGLDQDDLYR